MCCKRPLLKALKNMLTSAKLSNFVQGDNFSLFSTHIVRFHRLKLSRSGLTVVSPLHISTYPNIKLTHFHKISTKTPIYVNPPKKISPRGMKEDFGPCYST